MESFLEFFERKNGRREKWWTLENRVKKIQMLEEGLITSYSFESILAHLSNKYKDKIVHISKSYHDKEKGTAGIELYLKGVDDIFLNEMDKAIKVYGYFIAFKEVTKNGEIGIFLEPKFPFRIESKYIKNKKCYHITNKKYLNKIQKIGLVPRDSQTNFNFEGRRVYLMFSDNDQVIRLLGNKLASDKGWKSEDMVLLEIINFERLRIYFDMNFEPIKDSIAGFTYENISPSNLKIIS